MTTTTVTRRQLHYEEAEHSCTWSSASDGADNAQHIGGLAMALQPLAESYNFLSYLTEKAFSDLILD